MLEKIRSEIRTFVGWRGPVRSSKLLSDFAFAGLAAGILAMAGTGPALAGSYNVDAGKPKWLFSLDRYDVNRCAPGPVGKYNIVQPEHGTLKVVPRTGKLGHGPCASVKMTLHYIVYYPAPGYHGIDRGSISYHDNFYNDQTMPSNSTTETFIFNVR